MSYSAVLSFPWPLEGNGSNVFDGGGVALLLHLILGNTRTGVRDMTI